MKALTVPNEVAEFGLNISSDSLNGLDVTFHLPLLQPAALVCPQTFCFVSRVARAVVGHLHPQGLGTDAGSKRGLSTDLAPRLHALNEQLGMPRASLAHLDPRPPKTSKGHPNDAIGRGVELRLALQQMLGEHLDHSVREGQWRSLFIIKRHASPCETKESAVAHARHLSWRKPVSPGAHGAKIRHRGGRGRVRAMLAVAMRDELLVPHFQVSKPYGTHVGVCKVVMRTSLLGGLHDHDVLRDAL